MVRLIISTVKHHEEYSVVHVFLANYEIHVLNHSNVNYVVVLN